MVCRSSLSHSNDVIGACIHSNIDLHVNVCDSANCCGCVVNASVALVIMRCLSHIHLAEFANLFTLR